MLIAGEFHPVGGQAALRALAVHPVVHALCGGDGDGDRAGDAGDPVAVLCAGLRRRQQLGVILRGLHADARDAVRRPGVHAEIHLAVPVGADLAGSGVPGGGISCVRGAGAAVVPGEIGGDGRAAFRLEGGHVAGVLAGVGVREPQGAGLDVLQQVVCIVGPVGLVVFRGLHPLLVLRAGLQNGVAAVAVVVVADGLHLVVVHHGGGLDGVDHALEHIGQIFKTGAVEIILTVDLLHEILMAAEGLVDGGLVLGDFRNESALAGAPVTGGAEAHVARRGAHGVVQVPQRAGNELVLVGLAVAVEEDGACADVEVLDIFLHQVHLGKGFDVDIVGVVLPLAVVAVGGADGVPGVLEPRLDFRSGGVQAGGALVHLARVVEQQVVAHLFDGDQIVAGCAHAAAVQAVQGKLGISAVLHGLVFLVVVLLDQIAVLCHKGVILGRDGVAALVLAVHPDVRRGVVQADVQLMGQGVARAVGQQAVVADLGEDGPLLGLLAVNAENVALLAEGQVVGFLVAGRGPGDVSAALDLIEHHLLAVDIDGAGAGGFVVGIVVHGGDGTLALVDHDENGLDARRALPGLDAEALGLRSFGERIGFGLAGRGDRAGAAVILPAINRGLQPVRPGEEALGGVRVAGNVKLIGGGAAGGNCEQVDLRRQSVGLRRRNEHGPRQISLGGCRRQGNRRQHGNQHAQSQQDADKSFLHKSPSRCVLLQIRNGREPA